MSMIHALRVVPMFGIAATLLTQAASAEIVTMAYEGTGAGQNVRITSDLFTGDAFAGQIRQVISGGTSLDGHWRTFCTDLSQHVSSTPSPFEVVPVEVLPSGSPMGTEKASALRDLYAFAAGSQLLESTSNALAAAFQLAIWEVLIDFDGGAADLGLDVTTGHFSATRTNGDALSDGVMGHLSSMLGAIGQADGASVQLLGLASGQRQDQLIVVPAPAAFALLAAAGATRRRRR